MSIDTGSRIARAQAGDIAMPALRSDTTRAASSRRARSRLVSRIKTALAGAILCLGGIALIAWLGLIAWLFYRTLSMVFGS